MLNRSLHLQLVSSAGMLREPHQTETHKAPGSLKEHRVRQEVKLFDCHCCNRGVKGVL